MGHDDTVLVLFMSKEFMVAPSTNWVIGDTVKDVREHYIQLGLFTVMVT